MHNTEQNIPDYGSIISEKDSSIKRLESKIESLSHEIQLLKAIIHGKKSERFSGKEIEDAKQLILPSLFNELETIIDVSNDDNIDVPSDKAKKKVGRKPLPKDLPRRRVYHDLPESRKICHCNHEMSRIGEDVSEQLNYIPARIEVIEHVKYKYSCKHCYDNMQVAKPLINVIPGGIASSCLLAYSMVSKYADHIPYYRQAQIWQRLGIEISDSTLCNWNLQCSKLLEILVDMMTEDITSGNYVCSDETPLNVIESNKVQNYMWVYHSGSRSKRAIVFDYQETRKGECATNFLSGFEGIHQCDGYSGYNSLYKNNKILRSGCMDHARRKFFDVYKSSGKKAGLAKEVLKEIKLLYKVESEITKKSYPPDKILELRNNISRGIFDRLKLLLLKNKDLVPDKSPLGKAIYYMLHQWDSLLLYLDHAEVRISNADAERIIKPFTIGRKNWLFNQTKRGAKASAIVYSIIETCKANKVNAYEYLSYVLPILKKHSLEPEFKIGKEILPYNIDPHTINYMR